MEYIGFVPKYYCMYTCMRSGTSVFTGSLLVDWPPSAAFVATVGVLVLPVSCLSHPRVIPALKSVAHYEVQQVNEAVCACICG